MRRKLSAPVIEIDRVGTFHIGVVERVGGEFVGACDNRHLDFAARRASSYRRPSPVAASQPSLPSNENTLPRQAFTSEPLRNKRTSRAPLAGGCSAWSWALRIFFDVNRQGYRALAGCRIVPARFLSFDLRRGHLRLTAIDPRQVFAMPAARPFAREHIRQQSGW